MSSFYKASQSITIHCKDFKLISDHHYSLVTVQLHHMFILHLRKTMPYSLLVESYALCGHANIHLLLTYVQVELWLQLQPVTKVSLCVLSRATDCTHSN